MTNCTQSIVEAVARQLKSLYPENSIYQNEQEQGIQEPCFFISTVHSDGKRQPNQHHARSLGLSIAGLGYSRQEAIGVGETLLLELELLPLATNKGSLHGFDLSYRMVEDDLHFFVTYPSFYQEVIDKELMQELKTKAEPK